MKRSTLAVVVAVVAALVIWRATRGGNGRTNGTRIVSVAGLRG